MKKIPLGRPYINTELALSKIKEVLESRWISGGPRINEFEEKVKEYNNDLKGHYIAVSNCTTALEMALLTINDGKRLNVADEVIVPSWSWVASGFAVNNSGGTPVWCDINEYGIPYAEDIESRITSNTKAIIIVHQMGIPCDLDKINALSKKHNIPIIEDSACAFGTEYKGNKIGKSRNIVCYSFQARKCLTTGEGGMIVVRDPQQAEWLKSYRAFGTSVSPLERYNRDQVVDLLRKRNIGCKWDIQAIHKEPAYNQDHHDNNLPQTLKYHNQGLWLGFYAEITKEDQEYVIDQLKSVLKELK